jgi:hypothetical protein
MRAFMDDLAVRNGPHGGAELIMTKQLPRHEQGNGKTQNSRTK